ncbi:hypothetical protein NLG97_g2544 [Lecanicillium saksenae]|uniref:Uncharacterized protein n=1 Tax=Lecanicillium saksenae TaxID=468837 RepID=A0ACC1R389_9HYPO|nr:hypothetical protein NLG97_g2544 [Lecanicillium saksenae]
MFSQLTHDRIEGATSNVMKETIAGDHQLLGATAVVPTTTEVNLNHYFRNSIGAVAGDEFITIFWDYYVAQFGRSVPAIWHASNAVAGACWSRRPDSGLTPSAAALLDEESSKQYSGAVKHILRMMKEGGERPSPQTQTVVLLANIFLATYAVSVGEPSGFGSMYSTSRRLIRQWAFWECLDIPSLSVLATQILYFYIKTERIVSEFHPESITKESKLLPGESPMRWHDAVAYLQRRPMGCKIRACLELYMIWNCVNDVLDALPLEPSTEDISTTYKNRHSFYTLYKSWESRYASLVSSPSPPSALRNVGDGISGMDIVALDIRRLLLGIIFRFPISSCRPVWCETAWDSFEPVFEEAAGILERTMRCSDSTMLSVASLYTSCQFILHRCRSPVLRRKVLSVLRSSFDGSSSVICATVSLPLMVDEVVSLEESAWKRAEAGGECDAEERCKPSRFICNMHRVARVSIDRAAGNKRSEGKYGMLSY